MAQKSLLFDHRFLETFAGKSILHDPKTAIVELLANSWDAGATEVSVCWPSEKEKKCFEVLDNGCGMTARQFDKRWRTLAYNRLQEQGPLAEFPPDVSLPRRPAFGRNGVGRFAGFCFGDDYYVDTWRDAECVTFRVGKGDDIPIIVDQIGSGKKEGTELGSMFRSPSMLGFRLRKPGLKLA